MSHSLLAVSQRHAALVISLLALLSAAGIFFYSQAAANASGAGGSGVVETAGEPASESADDAQSGAGIMLSLARDAMRDGRLVAPAGSNGYEFYLSVLQLEPENRAAQEALRESFPRAAVEIERTINHRELDEARREIDLLREFDSNNYTLALLGGKLAAARNIESRQHEQEALRLQRDAAGRSAP